MKNTIFALLLSVSLFADGTILTPKPMASKPPVKK